MSIHAHISLYTNTSVISLILSLALSIRAHGLHVSKMRLASAYVQIFIDH